MSQSPILIYDPDGGVPSPPAFPPLTGITYPECGRTQLVSGQNWLDVTFALPKPDANWIFTDLQVINTGDAGPLNLVPGIVTNKTITGFRVQLNGLPNTNNYYLNWSVGGCATSDWVVSPGVSDFLSLSDTPDTYAGQTGKGIKVNATEDGLEFGVVSGGGGDVINVLDYGAKADCVTLFDITMPNGNVVTSAGYTFVSADIGKWAIIRGATASGVSPLIGKITAVSGHTATLSVATTTALTNLYTDSFPRMDFGTDNTLAFDLAGLAIPGPGNRNYYSSVPFASTGVLNPILPGDGGTLYIPRGHYLVLGGYPALGGTTFWWLEANNVTVKGDGMGQTVLYMNSFSGGTMPLFGGFAGSHGLFQNMTFCDYTVYDLNYFTGAGNSLDVRGANNVRIERIEICNSRGNGAINIQGYNTGGVPLTNRVYIRDCWVHGITEDGYSPSLAHSIEGDGMNVGQVRDVHIENNTISGPGRHGYEGGGNCADQYFIGNTIDMLSGGESGINPTGGSTTVVMGNTVKNVVGGNYGIDFTVDVGVWVANDIRAIGNYLHGTAMQAGFRFQNTSGTPATSHVDRIIVANNWVDGGTNPSTAGVLIGGTSGVAQSYQMLITGNWFGNLSSGLSTVDALGTATGKYIIIRNNFFVGAPADDNCLGGNIIIEGNITLVTAWPRYGATAMSCGIDTQSVAAGATYSNFAGGIGFRTTDSVEIVRGTTTAPGLIIWGVVTAANTVTTYAYNPTAGALNTGATCKYIVHRPIPL